MGEVCRFEGITIHIYPEEHNPPHFHARYAGLDVMVDIERLIVLRGRLSPRITSKVLEWAGRHQDELRRNWELASRLDPLLNIES